MHIGLKLSMLALAGSNLIFGSLIPIGQVPTQGAGLGSVQTLLTFSSPGSTTTESGCVGAGPGGADVTGASKCPALITGGNEQAINDSVTFASIGAANFTNVQLVFNAAEPAGNSITLNQLALTLWNPADGSLLGAFYLASPYVIANTLTGVGVAGYGFQLDTTQAAQANAILTAFPNLYVGVGASASDATGGLETIFVRSVTGGGTVPPNEVPEPSTYALVGATLLSAGFVGRKFRK